jgi:hypothetical protein
MGFDEAYAQRKSFRRFRPECSLLTGKWQRFTSWKTAAGHAIALFGLLSFAQWSYVHWFSPIYRDHVKPFTVEYVECMTIFQSC